MCTMSATRYALAKLSDNKPSNKPRSSICGAELGKSSLFELYTTAFPTVVELILSQLFPMASSSNTVHGL
jgi:hypothetical protein